MGDEHRSIDLHTALCAEIDPVCFRDSATKAEEALDSSDEE